MGIMNNNGGKGSGSRPLAVSRDEFAEKFDGIFGAKKRTNGGWTPPPLGKEGQFLKTNPPVEVPATTEGAKYYGEVKAALERGDFDTLITIDSLSETEGQKG